MSAGYIHSFQSLGTVDGPGVRFVVFFQGCNLRCKCCHNPDTWDSRGDAKLFEAAEVVSKAERFKEYFKDNGGITISGGEPLLQAEFAKDIFTACKEKGINTCLDTSGSILNKKIIELLDVTDRVLLDIKYTNNELYKENVGCSLDSVLKFLEILQSKNIPVTVRQVIMPTVNDDIESILKLCDIVKMFSCIDKVELLPFRKICSAKYEQMGIQFPFSDIPTPNKELMNKLNGVLSDNI